MYIFSWRFVDFSETLLKTLVHKELHQYKTKHNHFQQSYSNKLILTTLPDHLVIESFLKQGILCCRVFRNFIQIPMVWRITACCVFSVITNLSFCARPAWLCRTTPLRASWLRENALPSPSTSYTELWDSTARPDPVRGPDNEATHHIVYISSQKVLVWQCEHGNQKHTVCKCVRPYEISRVSGSEVVCSTVTGIMWGT